MGTMLSMDHDSNPQLAQGPLRPLDPRPCRTWLMPLESSPTRTSSAYMDLMPQMGITVWGFTPRRTTSISVIVRTCHGRQEAPMSLATPRQQIWAASWLMQTLDKRPIRTDGI